MHYVLLKTDFAVPPLEKLQRALRVLPGITDADSAKMAREASGMLAKRLTLEDARKMQAVLHADGIGSEVMLLDQLPVLPPAKYVRRIEITAQSLTVYDPLGRAIPVDWRLVTLISAGTVRSAGMTTSRHETQEVQLTSIGVQVKTSSELRHQVTENQQHLLEIIVGKGTMRFQADGAQLLFKFVIDRPELPMPVKFAMLVQMLCQHAPHAAVNHGAQAYRDNLPPVGFASPGTLSDDAVWAMWLSTRS